MMGGKEKRRSWRGERRDLAGEECGYHVGRSQQHARGNSQDQASIAGPNRTPSPGASSTPYASCIRSENQNQASFSPFGPHEISVLIELALGHLRYLLTDVPPQPNSPPDYVFRTDQPPGWATLKPTLCDAESQSNGISKK